MLTLSDEVCDPLIRLLLWCTGQPRANRKSSSKHGSSRSDVKLEHSQDDDRCMPEGAFEQPPQTSEEVDDSIVARLLGELPDTVVVIDSQCRVQWANRAAERLFNRSLRDSRGISGLELVHPDDLELVLRSLVSVQEKEVGTTIEVRVKTSDGWRLVEVIGAPVPWFEESAVLLTVRDVTERRRFELAHGEEARFRSLVQNSGAVTMLVSRAGRVESVSGALTRLLGHDPELVEQRPLADLVHESDRDALASALERALLGASAASPVTVELRLLRHCAARARSIRAHHRQLARGPYGRRLCHLCARRYRSIDSRAQVAPSPVSANSHFGFDGRRHPGRRR